MTESACHVRVLDDCVQPECLDRISDELQQLWAEAGNVADLDRMMFEIAIVELAGNVVQHRHGAGAGFECRVTIRVLPGSLEAVICDSGDRVDVDISGATMPDDLAEQGRGLPMARGAVDELTYERVGEKNRWRISRDRTG
jgi:serine/threonine-protein kinase RsbW